MHRAILALVVCLTVTDAKIARLAGPAALPPAPPPTTQPDAETRGQSPFSAA